MDTELKEGTNTGVIIQDPRETDFVAGAETGLTPENRNPTGDWTPFLPTDEMQIGVYFDTMACVTFSALNVIETQVNFMIREGMIPVDDVARMRVLGFFDENDKFNCSDRFTAKMSGTTRKGNTLVNVWDSIRRDGLLPERDWAYPRDQRTPVFDWADYYKEIPQELKAKALEILKILDIRYEWLVSGGRATAAQFSAWLKMSPIQIAAPVCPPWNTDQVIGSCSLPVGHATEMYMVKLFGVTTLSVFDHYKPFNKSLAQDYPIPFALRGVVYPKGKTTDLSFGRKLAGKLLLAVEDRGSLWYVTPDGRRAKIGNTPEEVEAFLQMVRDKRVPVLGIDSKTIARIATV